MTAVARLWVAAQGRGPGMPGPYQLDS